MASFNKVIIMGNLTRDPDIKTTQGGMTICKFSLAVNRSFTSKDGEKKDEVSFIDCDCMGKQAETLAKYMTKGKPILIEGRLKQDTWQDKTSGENRSKLCVFVESFSFVGGGNDNSQKHACQPAQTPQDNPDDVPF